MKNYIFFLCIINLVFLNINLVEASQSEQKFQKVGKDYTTLMNFLTEKSKNKDLKQPVLKDLEFAPLSNMDLSNINFKGANLKNANLSGSILKGSNFEDANLYNANLEKAIIDNNSAFINAIVYNTIWLNGSKIKNLYCANKNCSVQNFSLANFPDIFLNKNASEKDTFYTPLTKAVDKEDYKALEILLNLRFEPNVHDERFGWTPLFYAVNKPLNFVKILLEFNANPNIKESGNGKLQGARMLTFGKTPFTTLVGFAAVSKHFFEYSETLNLFLKPKYKININIEDDLGQTSLMLAIRHNNISLFNFLLKNGASIDCVDTYRKKSCIEMINEKPELKKSKYFKKVLAEKAKESAKKVEEATALPKVIANIVGEYLYHVSDDQKKPL